MTCATSCEAVSVVDLGILSPLSPSQALRLLRAPCAMARPENSRGSSRSDAVIAQTLTVDLVRESAGDRLGFHLGFLSDNSKFISTITLGTVADRPSSSDSGGKLQVFDVLVSINGMDVMSLSRKEVIKIIQTELSLSLLLLRMPPDSPWMTKVRRPKSCLSTATTTASGFTTTDSLAEDSLEQSPARSDTASSSPRRKALGSPRINARQLLASFGGTSGDLHLESIEDYLLYEASLADGVRSDDQIEEAIPKHVAIDIEEEAEMFLSQLQDADVACC